MKEVMVQEVAENEVDHIVEYFDMAPEGEEWQDTRKKLVDAMRSGLITLDEEKGAIVLKLKRPIAKENGEKIESLSFLEPTVNDLKVMDKYRDAEKIAKTIHMVSKMTGHPLEIVGRLGARDLTTVGAVTALFF